MNIVRKQKTHGKNILLLLFIVPFLMGMGVDLYVPSLPEITTYLHTKSSLVQLTISVYMLGYGIGQLFLGFLSDHWGRRSILLISASFYTILSFLIIFSPNIELLNIYRFMQGIGIAGLAVVTRAIIVDCFSGKTLSKMANYFVLSWTLGPIVGPFIGGYLQHYFFWQADFYFFSLYGLGVYLFILFYIPETNYNRSPLCFSKIYTNAHTIISNKKFFYLTSAASLGYAVIVLFNVIGPFLIQTVMHYSVVNYGYIALFLGVAYSFGSFCNRIAMRYFENIQLFFFSIICLIIFSGLMLILSIFCPLKLIIVLLPAVLVFVACGCIVPNGSASTMGIFPKIGGAASSIFGTLAGIIAFTVTFSGSLLRTNSLVPLACTYFVLSIGSLALFLKAK